MRVRYGKPIKVSNCYPYTKSTTIFPRSSTTSNSYLEVVHYDDAKVFSDVQDNLNHLYFFYAEINGNTSSLRNNILLGSNSLKQQSRYVDGNKFCAVAKLTSVGLTSLFFYINSNEQIGDFTVLFHCGIDITKAFGSGKEPTAQEFYNKYNKYFPLIAAGEEITIDDKAGQVSYYSQKSLKSIVGKQFGLTTDNSFNIYSVTSVATVALCNNKFGYSTVSDLASRFTNDDAIQIVEGHKYFVHVKVHNMLDRSAQRWMCMRFISTTGASYALSGNIYSYTWKFTTNTVSAILTGTTTGNLAYTYFGDFPDSLKMTIATEYPESYLIVDMTALGEDSLTVEEFYTKYKGYFSDLENGKQILVGKGKVAGGSSDIYYGYNQLSPLWTTDTYNGVTASIKNNGKDIELSGTATGWYIKDKNLGQTIPSGHKVLVMSEMINPTGANFGYRLRYNSNNPIYSNKEFNKIHTLTGNINKFQLYADLGDDCTGIKLNNLVIIDLTAWFGAGKEPNTIEEFKEKFAKEYYGFCSTPIKLTRYQIEALPNYGYNQLIKNGNFTDSSNWSVSSSQRNVLIQNNEIRMETLTQSYAIQNEQTGNAQFLYAEHKYLVHFQAKGSTADSTKTQQVSIKLYSPANGKTIFNQSYKNVTNSYQTFDEIIQPIETTSGTEASGGFRIYYQSNTGLSYVGDIIYLKDIFVIDLTDWYGEGKEPTTIEEFKQTFPNKYYAYSKKRLLNKYMINKLEN